MLEENRGRWPICVHCRDPIDLKNDDYQVTETHGVTNLWHTEPCEVKEVSRKLPVHVENDED